VKDETKLSDGASIEGNGDSHPWHGIDFGSDYYERVLRSGIIISC
jgi:hypothetical protein